MTNKITIVHPSRSRPEMAIATANLWLKRSYYDVDYNMVIDASDPFINEYIKLTHRHNYIKLHVSQGTTAIQAINWGAENIKWDGILSVVSDDFECPQDWDKFLLQGLDGKSDYIVKTLDGIQKTLITLPVMDKVYYDRFGYVYEKSYIHLFSDQEMTAVGHMLGKAINLPLYFEHKHYTVGGMAKDALNDRNDSSWAQGEELFNHRKSFNFGLQDSEIVKPYSEILWR